MLTATKHDQVSRARLPARTLGGPGCGQNAAIGRRVGRSRDPQRFVSPLACDYAVCFLSVRVQLRALRSLVE